MCKLVLLIVPILQRNENSQVVRARNDTNACTREFSTELIESSSYDALFRTVDIESGDWRVVGGLFGQIRNFDKLVVTGRAGCAA
jgi:hypothetical protein